VAGARGSTVRPETLVLARARRRARAGRTETLRLRISRGEARRLRRRRPVAARVAVATRAADGTVEAAVRSVRIGRGR
jgi:hypothetical protein